MTSRNLPLPYFPVPPREYSQQFFAEFLRSFAVYMAQAQNPGEGRATTIVLTNLQTNDVGLEDGTIFHINGALHIALSNVPHPEGNGMTASVGSVTVTV